MTGNRTIELLPCPFCGGQPDFQHFNITPKVKGRIICACGIELRQGANDTDDDMRIIWNTRSDYTVQTSNERKPEQAVAATLGDEKPKKCCSTCQYRYVTGQMPYPTFGYSCGFGDGKRLCGDNRSVLNHMGCEHWEKELK